MRQGKGQYQGDKSGPKVTTNERVVPERLLLEVRKGMTYSDQRKDVEKSLKTKYLTRFIEKQVILHQL